MLLVSSCLPPFPHLFLAFSSGMMASSLSVDFAPFAETAFASNVLLLVNNARRVQR